VLFHIYKLVQSLILLTNSIIRRKKNYRFSQLHSIFMSFDYWD